MRIRALLKAWTRSISDRYLDLQLVNQIANRRHASVDAAYDAIRANASTGGAVKFVRDELLAEQSNGIPTFFGSRMFDNYNWNTYYTMLLHWDDHHCYGLMQNLERQGNVSGGAGGRQGNMWLACRNWVENTLNNRTGSRRTVYHEYNIRFG